MKDTVCEAADDYARKFLCANDDPTGYAVVKYGRGLLEDVRAYSRRLALMKRDEDMSVSKAVAVVAKKEKAGAYPYKMPSAQSRITRRVIGQI
jgi:hypothetical protein